MRITNNINTLNSQRNSTLQVSKSNQNKAFQKNSASKNPSFGSVSAPALILCALAAAVPLVWINDQKWSGPTLDQINKKDEAKREAKELTQSLESAEPKLQKFIKKLLKKSKNVA